MLSSKVKLYMVATLAGADKYLIMAQYNAASNKLTVPRNIEKDENKKPRSGIQRISKIGFYNRPGLIKRLAISRQAGVTTLVETRDEKFVKYSPIIDLSARAPEGRPFRDRYYEKLKSMFEAREIDLPPKEASQIKGSIMAIEEQKTLNTTTGKTLYDFREQENNVLSALLVLIAAHVDPPKGVDFFLEVEKNLTQAVAPRRSRRERMLASIDRMEERMERDLEERTKRAHQNIEEFYKRNPL